MKLLNKLIVALALAPALAFAGGGDFPLDRADNRTGDMAALQNGAKIFVNYCLSCHMASSMRYNRLKDIGLTDEQIKENLLFSGEKVGALMTTTLSPKDGKAWFGAVPPDLSVIARAKASANGSGPDWLYTYLRTFYKDDSRPTGWNNLVFPNVGMPHVLWELQGVRAANFEEKTEHGETKRVFTGYDTVTPGKLTPAEYDESIADLVAYLQWMGEPAQNKRKTLGIFVVLFLAGLAFSAWRLNKSFWKEVK